MPGAIGLAGGTTAVAAKVTGWPLLRHVWPTFARDAPPRRVGQGGWIRGIGDMDATAEKPATAEAGRARRGDVDATC